MIGTRIRSLRTQIEREIKQRRPVGFRQTVVSFLDQAALPTRQSAWLVAGGLSVQLLILIAIVTFGRAAEPSALPNDQQALLSFLEVQAALAAIALPMLTFLLGSAGASTSHEVFLQRTKAFPVIGLSLTGTAVTAMGALVPAAADGATRFALGVLLFTAAATGFAYYRALSLAMSDSEREESIKAAVSKRMRDSVNESVVAHLINTELRRILVERGVDHNPFTPPETWTSVRLLGDGTIVDIRSDGLADLIVYLENSRSHRSRFRWSRRDASHSI